MLYIYAMGAGVCFIHVDIISSILARPSCGARAVLCATIGMPIAMHGNNVAICSGNGNGSCKLSEIQVIISAVYVVPACILR